MSEENKAVVLKFIEAMNTGDADTAATCIAPDAFTLAKGHSKVAGVREHDTILWTINAFKTLIPGGMGVKIVSVTDQDNRVVVEFEGDGTTCEGVRYHNEYCMVFTLEDGLIKQVNEYFCTLHAEQVILPLIERMAQEEASA